MSVILGINAYHPGAAAAVVVDGKPVAAIAEERLNRVKYYARFPKLAIKKCLEMAGLAWRDVDAVAIGRDASANVNKKIEYALKNPSSLLNLLKIKRSRGRLDDLREMIAAECEVAASELKFKQHNIEHHLAHTASSYFVSPWDHAAGITVDGSGDFVTCLFSECRDDTLSVKRRIFVPHSLGSLYTMICQFIGYGSYGDEGKVMGLAPLGTDRYHATFNEMITLSDKGIELNPKFFVPFGANQGMTIRDTGEMDLQRHYSDLVVERFGSPRVRHAELSARDKDLAFGLQRVFETAYFHLLNQLHRAVPTDRLVLAGGCALNSVANGKLFAETPFRETCVQPAAGDEGLALGAALYVSNVVLKEKRRFVMRDAYLGPAFSDDAIQRELERSGVPFTKHDRSPLLDETVTDLAAGRVIGWFQGRMEWGPRALGNRSIIAHPGLPNMKDVLNARIKHREWFRPFAPSVLAERQSELFEHDHPSPFMLHVYKIRPAWRERLCAVNHVDDTGRLQTVARDENPLYYDLIQRFSQKTGIPVILNTSFNENEPIVCTPEEAIDCYRRTKMDTLVIGTFVCRKEPPTTS